MSFSNLLRHSLKRVIPAGLVNRIKKRRLQAHLAGFHARTVRHLYAGHEFSVRIADSLAEGWYDHDWAVLPEITALKESRLRLGARLFDLGAHQGVVAMILAKETGPGGQVVAVEGSLHNAAIAKTNFRLNELPSIEILQAVVADQAGVRVAFHEELNGRVTADGHAAGTVVSVTVDELTARFGRPDVVVIDVEGFECAVLRGATNTLQLPVDWLIEVHQGCGLEKFGSVDELISYFPVEKFGLRVAAGESSQFQTYQPLDPLPVGKCFLLASALLS